MGYDSVSLTCWETVMLLPGIVVLSSKLAHPASTLTCSDYCVLDEQMGQDVKVRIIEVDVDRQKLRLTMRDPEFDEGSMEVAGAGSERAPRRKTNSVEAYLNIPPDEWISGTVRTRFIGLRSTPFPPSPPRARFSLAWCQLEHSVGSMLPAILGYG